MSDSNTLSKLGSSASIIEVSNDIYKKSHILNKNNEYFAIEKGIKCLKKEVPDTIHEPLTISHNFDHAESSQLRIAYEQSRLSPWIEPQWITGEQIYSVGMKYIN